MHGCTCAAVSTLTAPTGIYPPDEIKIERVHTLQTHNYITILLLFSSV